MLAEAEERAGAGPAVQAATAWAATDGAGGRALRVEYEAAAGALRYSARLDARTPERAPTTVLAASMC